MIDWTTIIVTILGIVTVESVFKIIDRIRYKNQDRTMRKDEVQKATTETDRQQIDLGDLFLEKSQKWSEILESKLEQVNAQRNEDWRTLKANIEWMMEEIGNIVEFLDGPFTNFKAEKNGNKKTKAAKKRPVPRKRGHGTEKDGSGAPVQ